MASIVDTRVARCESCNEVVPTAGNTIRLWGGSPPARLSEEGQVVLAPAPVVEWLLVCPACRRRTRITDLF
jgi:hypothetical protein